MQIFANDFIAKIVQFLDRPKKVYVVIYTRDENNCVIAKKEYPVETVFSHTSRVMIHCEESQMKDMQL